MRAYLLTLVLALLLGALLMWQIQAGSGYVVIGLGHTAVEMSFWTASILLLLLSAGLFWLDALCRWISRMGGLRHCWRQRRRVDREQRNISGLRAYSLGLWDIAGEQLQTATELSLTASINLPLAARSQAQAGNLDTARVILQRQKKLHPASILDADLILVDILTNAGQSAEAEQILVALEYPDGTDATLLSALLEAHIRAKKWPIAVTLLKSLSSVKGLRKSYLTALEERIYRGQLNAFLNINGCFESSLENRRERLDSLWASIPRRMRKLPKVVALYAKCLDSVGAGAEAKVLLIKTLKLHWRAELIELFGNIRQPTSEKHLACAENWLRSNPNDRYLLEALGKICRSLEFFVKATDYLQRANQLSSSPGVHAELAAVKAEMGDISGSATHYREGLLALLSGRSDAG